MHSASCRNCKESKIVMQNLETLLDSLKDFIGLEFRQTVNGREIKGYHDGSKIYFDSTNCIELAELFLKISYHLEAVDSNFSKSRFENDFKERLNNLFDDKICSFCGHTKNSSDCQSSHP